MLRNTPLAAPVVSEPPATEPAAPATRPAAVFICDTPDQADQAIRTLHRAGFDVRKLSLIGKGSHGEAPPLGFDAAGQRLRAWGGRGAFWGGEWGLRAGPAVFMLPGGGPAALDGNGMAVDDVIRCETSPKADRCLLMVHGDTDDAIMAHAALSCSDRGAHPHAGPGGSRRRAS